MTASNTDIKAVNAMVDKKAQIRADIQKQFLAMTVQIHQIVGDQIFYELSRAFKAHHRMMGRRVGGYHGMGWQHPQATISGKPMVDNAPWPDNQ